MSLHKDLAEDLKKYLCETKDYKEQYLFINVYSYHNTRYSRLEVKNRKGFIIQAFVVMTAVEKGTLKEYPFHRKYNQTNLLNVRVNPSCSVAVKNDDDTWSFYDTTNLSDKRPSNTFLNYDRACEQFDKRFGKRLINRILASLWVSFGLGIIYFALHILSINEVICFTIPFDGSVILLLVFFTVLPLIPLLLPYIKSLNLPGVSIDINGDKNPSKR